MRVSGKCLKKKELLHGLKGNVYEFFFTFNFKMNFLTLIANMI